MTTFSFKKISQELFSLALPMTFTQLIAVGSGFLSMAMVSGLGSDVLAASALIFSARITFMIIGSSILFSLSVLIGHAYGEREYIRIGNFIQQGWLLGVLLSLPVMFLFWNMRTLLIYTHQSVVLADISEQFFRANIWNVIPFFMAVCNQQLCYGARKQQIDLIGNLLGVVVLLLSAYLLIFGKWGCPKLGIEGLGYALSLQGWAYFIFTMTIFYYDKFFQRFELFTMRLHKSLPDLIRLFKLGWPICMQIGGEMISFFALAAMIGWVNEVSLAAYQIVSQYFILIICPLYSLSQACGVLIGQAYGEKNNLKLNKIAYVGILFSLIMSFVAALAFIFCPKLLAALYMNVHLASNQAIMKISIILFVIYAAQLMFDGVRHVLTGSLRGLLDTQFPMMAGLFAIWVIGIPLAYVLAFHYGLGAPGILAGDSIGIFVGVLPLIYRWYQKNKKFAA